MIRNATRKAYDSKFRTRVGAVVAKGHRILSTGCNRIGYSRFLPNRPYPESIHAEQQAILNLLKEQRLDDLVGATVYVSRINSRGECRMARPCRVCHDLCRAVGIKKVIFTANNGVESYEL